MKNSLQMMQFADSAFPLGGFAFSNGLEWMVKHRIIGDVTTFKEYLNQLVQQSFCFEIPFILAMGLEPDEKQRASLRYDRMIYNPAQRRASLAQGKALLRLLPSLDMGNHEDFWNSGNLAQSHFVLVLGSVLAQLSWDQEDIANLYIYLITRDQISAAIRLGAIGPTKGVEIQQSLFWAAEEYQEKSVPSYLETYRFTPFLDIALTDHHNLYTKLFQN